MPIGTDLKEIAFITDDGQFVVDKVACSILVDISVCHHISRGRSTFGNIDDISLVGKVRFLILVADVHRERGLSAEYIIEIISSSIADTYDERIPYSTCVFPFLKIEGLDTIPQ